jgi:hypothetical protein
MAFAPTRFNPANVLGNTHKVVFSNSFTPLIGPVQLILKPTIIQDQALSFRSLNTFSHPSKNTLTVARGLK